MKEVPRGSMWRVLPFIPPSIRKTYAGRPAEQLQFVEGIRAWSQPRPFSASEYGPDEVLPVKLAPESLILVGDTVPTTAKVDHDWWFVEILMPVHCYVNRTQFNPGSGYLERVA